MSPVEMYQQANRAIEGAPEKALTIGLFIIAAVAIAVAVFGSPVIKGVVMAWFILP